MLFFHGLYCFNNWKWMSLSQIDLSLCKQSELYWLLYKHIRIVKMHAKSCYKAFKEHNQYSHSNYEKSRFISTSPVFFSYTTIVISVFWTYSNNYSRHSSTQCKLCKNIQMKKSYSNGVFIVKLMKHVLFFDSKQAINF